jgi:hypothetical protein
MWQTYYSSAVFWIPCTASAAVCAARLHPQAEPLPLGPPKGTAGQRNAADADCCTARAPRHALQNRLCPLALRLASFVQPGSTQDLCRRSSPCCRMCTCAKQTRCSVQSLHTMLSRRCHFYSYAAWHDSATHVLRTQLIWGGVCVWGGVYNRGRQHAAATSSSMQGRTLQKRLSPLLLSLACLLQPFSSHCFLRGTRPVHMGR